MAERNIYQRLMAVQKTLKAPKGQYNEYGKYKYRSCEDILEAVKPILAENGLTLVIRDEIEIHGEWHYIKAVATLMDETGATISNQAYAREPVDKKGMDQSQITGTASSYARKYCLNGLFLIDDTKDPDTNEHRKETEAKAQKQEQKQERRQEKKPEQKKPEPITPVMADGLAARCIHENVPVQRIMRLYRVQSLGELTDKEYRNIVDNWEKIKEVKDE